MADKEETECFRVPPVWVWTESHGWLAPDAPEWPEARMLRESLTPTANVRPPVAEDVTGGEIRWSELDLGWLGTNSWRKRLYGRSDVRLFFNPRSGSLVVLCG